MRHVQRLSKTEKGKGGRKKRDRKRGRERWRERGGRREYLKALKTYI